ncbi:MAG: CBS domain-containing protein [Deltaproteobacteria bacterium]|nr:CBS domain-containing protein [Deltaproteobacteria bacterium]
MLTVEDVMTRRPTAVLESAPLRAAAATMRELDVRHLPVLTADHELAGMLSDRDLGGLPPEGIDPEELTPAQRHALEVKVAAVMSTDVKSVTADQPLLEAIELLIEHRIGAIPVLSLEGRVVGILSYVDVLRAYARDLVESE